ncbi:hypothetical protein BC938DRAFT_472357 [Jimgerdemannia flammicorona]|uniref:Uncharacterized protein n=1 Tax=Jimgerdemannia flammicorona TaxID=994334 RepID=A0A433Q6C3_9FUNG|nr:hypothetical protein BC938DRAFT_472357 [Jimgerdemannia flammicorona]
MSLSLYGDLPKPKTTNPEETKGGDPTKASSLYGDLPKPAGSSSATSGASPSAPAVPHYAQMLHLHTVLLVNRYSNIPPTNKLFHNAAVIIHSIPGWSAITQFKPIIRKPVIQAKPKLHKPTSAPASLTGPPATSLSHQIVYSAPPTASQHDAAPTGQGPGKSFGGKLVSEDVNGFKAINNLKEKVYELFLVAYNIFHSTSKLRKRTRGKTNKGRTSRCRNPRWMKITIHFGQTITRFTRRPKRSAKRSSRRRGRHSGGTFTGPILDRSLGPGPDLGRDRSRGRNRGRERRKRGITDGISVGLLLLYGPDLVKVDTLKNTLNQPIVTIASPQRPICATTDLVRTRYIIPVRRRCVHASNDAASAAAAPTSCVAGSRSSSGGQPRGIRGRGMDAEGENEREACGRPNRKGWGLGLVVAGLAKMWRGV